MKLECLVKMAFSISMIFEIAAICSVSAETIVFDCPEHEYLTGSIPCKLFAVSHLDCSGRYLNVIPTLPMNITSIDLSRNSIMNLSESSFRGQALLANVERKHTV